MNEYAEFMCTNFFKVNDLEEVADILDEFEDVEFFLEDNRLMLYVQTSVPTKAHLPAPAQLHENTMLEQVVNELAPVIDKDQTVLCMSMGMVNGHYIAGFASAFKQGWVGMASFDHILNTVMPAAPEEGVKPN